MRSGICTQQALIGQGAFFWFFLPFISNHPVYKGFGFTMQCHRLLRMINNIIVLSSGFQPLMVLLLMNKGCIDIK